MSVVSAVYSYLINETAITDGLSTYDFGSGAVPSIFTVDDIPEDAGTPFIRISPIGGYLSGRDRANRGGIVNTDVALWWSKGDSEKTMRELADELWFTLDRAPITVDGMDCVYFLADPPRRGNDSDGFPGFVIACRCLVRKA